VTITKIPTIMLEVNTDTDALKMPSGTTAQRGTGAAGKFRYNSETEEFEGFTDVWGSLGGAIDDVYFTLTPTLTSPSNNRITVGNYSSFLNPVFVTKVGSTVVEHVNTAGTIFMVSQPSVEGSQTVTVEVRELSKLQNIGNTITVGITSTAARYWRITGMTRGDFSSNFDEGGVSGWQLYPEFGQGGTKLGSASAITSTPHYYTDGKEQNLYAKETTGSLNWYSQTASTMADDWIMYDLGSDMLVFSMRISPYNATLWQSNYTIQSSLDNVTWTTVHTQTPTDGTSQLFDLT
jgi:hypothetical protein